VGPKLYLALLWHQHQPIYKDTSHPTASGSYIHPWVRLHAIRDYYSMAALVAEHPGIHLTINLTPSLLWQIEDYLEHGATDRTLELTLKPAELLTPGEREAVLSTFFDANWHNQIFPHPRYKALFEQRRRKQEFADQDVRDLQMWFNLAWFGSEFRKGDVKLATGEIASVHCFVEQGSGFTTADIEAMVAEQYKIMRAIIPIHRQLQEHDQVEVSATPFYHPILPLLVDSDRATPDRIQPPLRQVSLSANVTSSSYVGLYAKWLIEQRDIWRSRRDRVSVKVVRNNKQETDDGAIIDSKPTRYGSR
jgi:alpha-amylase/alpha-mannosidase (GH57 family)